MGRARRDSPTLAEFFDLLGARRCAQVARLGARYADAFCLGSWPTKVLDEGGRQAWNDAQALARADAGAAGRENCK